MATAPNPNNPAPARNASAGSRGPSKRIAGMSTPNYNPRQRPLEAEMRITEYTPPRLTLGTEIRQPIVTDVTDAALGAAPFPNHSEDNNAPDLNGRLVWAHLNDRKTEQNTMLRVGHDLRSCGRELNVESFTNIIQSTCMLCMPICYTYRNFVSVEQNSHGDFDNRLYFRRPVKKDMMKLLDIVKHNERLAWNDPNRWDVREVGHLFSLQQPSLNFVRYFLGARTSGISSTTSRMAVAC